MDLDAPGSLTATQEKPTSLFRKYFDLKSVLSICVYIFTVLRTKQAAEDDAAYTGQRIHYTVFTL